jgi:hypothetical protein
LRKEKGTDCGSSADFLEKFLSDFKMPDTESELPDLYDIPDHCQFEGISCDGFRWSYLHNECPYLSAGHVYEGKENEPYVISFNYENPKSLRRDRINAVEIRIMKHIKYGTSAYPLMVMLTLDSLPKTQGQIIHDIHKTWDTLIDRKTIGRHLQLLQDFGLPVHHSLEGYYFQGTPGELKPGIKLSPNAYPLLIMKTLNGTPKTQAMIIWEINEKYGIKIDRKAVVRHLDLLKALGIHSL